MGLGRAARGRVARWGFVAPRGTRGASGSETPSQSLRPHFPADFFQPADSHARHDANYRLAAFSAARATEPLTGERSEGSQRPQNKACGYPVPRLERAAAAGAVDPCTSAFIENARRIAQTARAIPDAAIPPPPTAPTAPLLRVDRKQSRCFTGHARLPDVTAPPRGTRFDVASEGRNARARPRGSSSDPGTETRPPP
ncbi:unnamed protein product [Lampetra planeri]